MFTSEPGAAVARRDRGAYAAPLADPRKDRTATPSLSSPVTVLCWLILKEIELPNCQRSNANVSFAASSYGDRDRLVRRGSKNFREPTAKLIRDAFLWLRYRELVGSRGN
jgi:hypothetical protein